MLSAVTRLARDVRVVRRGRVAAKVGVLVTDLVDRRGLVVLVFSVSSSDSSSILDAVSDPSSLSDSSNLRERVLRTGLDIRAGSEVSETSVVPVALVARLALVLRRNGVDVDVDASVSGETTPVDVLDERVDR